MNWYIKLSQSIRYFKVTTNRGTMVMRAIKPEHIYRLYDVIDIEELNKEEAAAWDADDKPIQHVFAYKNILH